MSQIIEQRFLNCISLCSNEWYFNVTGDFNALLRGATRRGTQKSLKIRQYSPSLYQNSNAAPSHYYTSRTHKQIK
jgi:2-hydroxy-3-keto-5-methylthiopentenyl-1-phosphate phosphatase